MLKHAYAVKSKSAVKDGTGNKSRASTRSVSEDKAEVYKEVISKAAQNAQSKASFAALYQKAAAQNIGPLAKSGPAIKPGKPIKPLVKPAIKLGTAPKPVAIPWYIPKDLDLDFLLKQASKSAVKYGASTRSVSGDVFKRTQNEQSKARLEALYYQAAAQNLGPLVKPGPAIKTGKPIKPEVVAWHDLQSLVALYNKAYAIKPTGVTKTKPAIKYEAGIKSGVATRAVSIDKDAVYKPRLAAVYKQAAGQKLAYGINPADLTKTKPAIKVGVASKAELAHPAGTSVISS